jgi:hypothetical protein
MDLDSTIFKDGITIMECSICYVNKVEISFLCKHSVCQSCYRNIEICPFCRKRVKPKEPVIEIEQNIRINDPDEVTRNPNFYFVLCVMLTGPMIWVCFALGVILNSNI